MQTHFAAHRMSWKRAGQLRVIKRPALERERVRIAYCPWASRPTKRNSWRIKDIRDCGASVSVERTARTFLVRRKLAPQGERMIAITEGGLS